MMTLLPANSKYTSVGSQNSQHFRNSNFQKYLNTEGQQNNVSKIARKYTKVLVWSQGFQKCIVCLVPDV